MLPAFTNAIDDLARSGWHTADTFFEPQLLNDLRQTILQLQQAEAFRPAQIGKGPHQTRQAEVRGDWIRWLSDHGDFAATKKYLHVLDEFRQSLNRELFLGAHEYEAHFSIYPPGSFYRKHLDRHRHQPHRLLTTTLYLNQGYEEQQGGALVLEDRKAQIVAKIAPQWGRFVCFLSADFPHQVMPTTVERYSLTGWMRSRS